jgi:hypothetical protein
VHLPPTRQQLQSCSIACFIAWYCVSPDIHTAQHYYKMCMQFTSLCSLDQWIHCLLTTFCSLQQPTSEIIQNLMKSLDVQRHLLLLQT